MAKSNKSKVKKKTAKTVKKTAGASAGKIPKAGGTGKTGGQTIKKKPLKKKKDTLMCFLTTACMNYYSLPDDAYELTTLRNYRDTYLASSLEGRKLIRQYYEVSPKIVELANADAERKTVYAFIYDRIRSACSEIEKRDYPAAKTIYLGLVKNLMKRYGLRL